MSDFIKIAAAVFIVCIAVSVLKDIKREYAFYLSAACGVFVLTWCISQLGYVKNVLNELISLSDVSLSALKIFFKAVGITVITSVTSDACLDSGNRFLASCVELSGKIAVTVSALPLINSVVKIIAGYIGN